jgi:hypothetical protein
MTLIYFLYSYLAVGLLFALYFIFVRLPQIDANAKQTSIRFKLMILPGCILLWPLLINKKEIKH